MMSKFKNKLVPIVVALILFFMLHHCYGQSLNLYLSQIEKSDFPEIKLFIDVLDNTNKPVKTLKRSNFELIEDGKPVEITSFAAPGTPRPLTTVLILDRSGSMDKDNKLISMKEAARTYVSLMKENDYTSLIVFNNKIKELRSFTNEKDILYKNVNSITSGGATAFYDAVYKGVKNLIPIRGHKVVLALTDGMDNKSWKSIEKTVDFSVKHGIPVLTIGLGSQAQSGQEEGIYDAPLKLLAERTGGRYYYAPNAAQLTQIYRNVAIMLQSSYEMTYISTNQIKDGTTREVIVSTSNDIMSKNGANSYYIPGVIVPGSSWPVFLGILFPLIILLFAPQALKRYKFSIRTKTKTIIKTKQSIILILDTSSYMSGELINTLNKGINVLKNELLNSKPATEHVDISIITFGGNVKTIQEFCQVEKFRFPELIAEGDSCLGDAILFAVDSIEKKRAIYEAQNVQYYRPWLFMITNGEQTDMTEGDNKCQKVIEKVHDGEKEGKFLFFIVGLSDSNMNLLKKISYPDRQPLKLRNMAFIDLFKWLSLCISKICATKIGEKVQLPSTSSWSAK